MENFCGRANCGCTYFFAPNKDPAKGNIKLINQIQLYVKKVEWSKLPDKDVMCTEVTKFLNSKSMTVKDFYVKFKGEKGCAILEFTDHATASKAAGFLWTKEFSDDQTTEVNFVRTKHKKKQNSKSQPPKRK